MWIGHFPKKFRLNQKKKFERYFFLDEEKKIITVVKSLQWKMKEKMKLKWCREKMKVEVKRKKSNM